MIIDNGVEMLQLEAEAFGHKSTLCPMLLWEDKTAVLIDVGMPGGWPQIQAAMLQNGVDPKQLKAIILTHQDLDHIGSIEEIKQELGDQVIIYAHENDKPHIEGDLPLIKSSPAAMTKLLEALPEEQRKQALRLCTYPPKARVDRTVAHGDVLPYCGGIQVIHTPGHTDGHISLFLNKSKTLVAADAMMTVNGKLHGPILQTSLNLSKAQQSLKNFLDVDFDSVICYHGGLCEFDAKEQLRQIIEQFGEA